MAEREGVVKFRAEHREEDLPSELAEVAAGLAAWRHPLRALGWIGQETGRYDGFGFGNLSARLPRRLTERLAQPLEQRVAARRGAPGTAGRPRSTGSTGSAVPHQDGGNFAGGPGGPRAPRPFLVTGTQTGGAQHLDLEGFALVVDWDLTRNRLWSRGRIAASSESLTHAALYEAGAGVGAVFHVHAPELWRRRRDLDLPETDPAVPYGTPEMAEAVARAWRRQVEDPAPEGEEAEVERTGAAGAEPPPEGEAPALLAGGLLAMGGHEDGLLAWGETPDRAGQALLDALLQLG